MSSIPDFCDGYHLPPGEHECTMGDIEQRFVCTPQRERVWADFNRLLGRLESLEITPKKILIDGSFVTGREEPGDVDFGSLIPPSKAKAALRNFTDPYDKHAIMMFTDPAPQNQKIVRTSFGAHMLVAANELGMKMISRLFRTGGEQFGQLKPPDPKRDPDWVKTPKEKGILKVDL